MILGSGDPALEAAFRELALAHPRRIAARIGYNEGLAHRIEAGKCDIFLMPSRYEPCGLNQIYSSSLWDHPHRSGHRRPSGYGRRGDRLQVHGGMTPTDLAVAATAALNAFKDRQAWTKRMRAGMAKDFSWDASAVAYQRLYFGSRST